MQPGADAKKIGRDHRVLRLLTYWKWQLRFSLAKIGYEAAAGPHRAFPNKVIKSTGSLSILQTAPPT